MKKIKEIILPVTLASALNFASHTDQLDLWKIPQEIFNR
jgi:hypothetical protein